MIARIWRGATRADDADAYLSYLHRTGIAEYRGTAGNAGVLVMRRLAGDRAEFVLLSLWESMDAVHGFAGADADRAVFYPKDDAFLVERDEGVTHFAVVFETPRAPASPVSPRSAPGEAAP